MWTTIVTPSTPSTMTRTITTRTICTSEHSSAPLVVFLVLMIMCHTTLAQVHWVCHLIFTPCICAFLSDLSDLPFYFNMSFPVFFLSSVLMYPDLHTDLNNLDSVENNLRHSAKGSLDAYDVTHSLVMSPTTRSPTTRSPTSSSTPRVPSPTLLRHRTRT